MMSVDEQKWPTRGVSTICGQSVHNRMPLFASRGLKDWAKWTRPAFAAAYTGAAGIGKMPPAEAVKRITPASPSQPLNNVLLKEILSAVSLS